MSRGVRPGLIGRLLVAVFALLLPVRGDATEASPLLYVYHLPPLLMQSRQDYEAASMPREFSPLFFGRYRDFAAAIERDRPALVLAPASFARVDTEYRPLLQLTVEEQRTFPLLLVTLREPGHPPPAAGKTIGLVAELPREYMDDYAAQLFPGFSFATVRRVPVQEDILPLLGLEMVDYAGVRPELFHTLEQRFGDQMVKVAESQPEPYPLFFIRRDLPDALTHPLLELAPETLERIGFSGIELYNATNNASAARPGGQP